MKFRVTQSFEDVLMCGESISKFTFEASLDGDSWKPIPGMDNWRREVIDAWVGKDYEITKYVVGEAPGENQIETKRK